MHTLCLLMQYEVFNLVATLPGVRKLKVGDEPTVYFQAITNMVSIIFKFTSEDSLCNVF